MTAKNTGMNSPLPGSGVNIYPNPFWEILVLDNVSEFYRVTVVNADGKVILTENINHCTTYELEAEGLREGIYSVILVGKKSAKVIMATKL